MHPNTKSFAGVVVQAQIEQRLTCVVVGLAAGDQTKAVVLTANHRVVQTVGAYVGESRIPFVIEQTRFLRQRIIRPSNVQAAGRHLKLRNNDLQTLRINVYRGTGLDNFLNGFHAGPDTGETAHRKAVQTEVQHLLH